MKKLFIFSSILFILSSGMMIFTMFSNNDTSYHQDKSGIPENYSISEVNEDEYNFDIEESSSVVAEDVYDSDIKEYHRQLRAEQEASQSSYEDEDVFSFGQYEEREGNPNPIYTDGTMETATGNEERYQEEPYYDEVFKTKADREAAEDALANLFIDTFKRKMEYEYYKMIYD